MNITKEELKEWRKLAFQGLDPTDGGSRNLPEATINTIRVTCLAQIYAQLVVAMEKCNEN